MSLPVTSSVSSSKSPSLFQISEDLYLIQQRQFVLFEYVRLMLCELGKDDYGFFLFSREVEDDLNLVMHQVDTLRGKGGVR